MKLPDWPRALGEPLGRACLRSTPEDFIVEEYLGFTPEGEGEHHYLWVEKRGANTRFVAQALGQFAGVKPRAVSFAGMKDRHALTRQWFSVHIPGKAEPQWTALDHPEFRVLESYRHRKKLKTGVHRGNRFTLGLRQVEGSEVALEARLQTIARRGVPNYFGEQRFGIDGGNLGAAQAWVQAGCGKLPRARRSILLSAIRAFLFNSVVAGRVAAENWDRALEGDVFMPAGTNNFFTAALDDDIDRRMAAHDIDASASLFGTRRDLAGGEAAMLEGEVARAHPQWLAALAAANMKEERRRLRLLPEALTWHWEAPQRLSLSFSLPKGCFATAVVRELVDYFEAPR